MDTYSREKEILEKISKIPNDNKIENKKPQQNKKYPRLKENIFYLIIKRIVDIFAGLIGTIILIPLIIIVWLDEKINKEEGPLFYSQMRIGKNGKLFRIFKFRSMVIGADEKLNDYLNKHPKEKEKYKKYKKLENDPRITKTGRFLRRKSLDEWPQFLNVLGGSMSLVGPRPYLPNEMDDMGLPYITITSVKPGLTGPWQVEGRSNLLFEDRLKLDMEYCRNKNPFKDFVILFKTFKKVFMGEGAK